MQSSNHSVDLVGGRGVGVRILGLMDSYCFRWQKMKKGKLYYPNAALADIAEILCLENITLEMLPKLAFQPKCSMMDQHPCWFLEC